MKLPISFEEVSYFNNEYRGDLIITKNVLYYFPHTRVVASRYSEEIGGKDAMVVFDVLGNFAPLFGAVPFLRITADISVKAGKLLKRTFRPTTNFPRIRKLRLWQENCTSENLQVILDEYIESAKKEKLEFDEGSIPKPMRFEAGEIKNPILNIKFKFETKYDTHDFRVNLIHRNLFRGALKAGGFLS